MHMAATTALVTPRESDYRWDGREESFPHWRGNLLALASSQEGGKTLVAFLEGALRRRSDLLIVVLTHHKFLVSLTYLKRFVTKYLSMILPYHLITHMILLTETEISQQ